ncbi:MAG: methionyl-tRNA formyltransferase [Ferruginibacter sp.]|nr:methionyl-tRNA formyltransferase [Ferruginibacter sp.]
MIEKNKEAQHIPAATAFPFGGGKPTSGLRIVFMGTPEFAVASLDRLVQSGYNIVGVITAPDKPGGRGMEMQQSAVKEYALAQNLHVLQPEKLKNPVFIEQLRSLHADLQVVVAFRMLPEVVWNMPPKGTINVHGSLLPQYRGAAPINWAIINGEKFTGVTTFKLRHEIDTGDILLQESFAINEEDDAGQVHDTMKEIGAGLLIRTIRAMENNELKELPQEEGAVISKHKAADTHSSLLHAPKIFTETCLINWNNTTGDIYNLIRGLSPSPAAFTSLQHKKLKIFKAQKIITAPTVAPGEFETDQKTYLRFASIDGFIGIIELQMEGKKKMGINDFLRGYRFDDLKEAGPQEGRKLT